MRACKRVTPWALASGLTCRTPAHRWECRRGRGGRGKPAQGGVPAAPCPLPLTPWASGYSFWGGLGSVQASVNPHGTCMDGGLSPQNPILFVSGWAHPWGAVAMDLKQQQQELQHAPLRSGDLACCGPAASHCWLGALLLGWALPGLLHHLSCRGHTVPSNHTDQNNQVFMESDLIHLPSSPPACLPGCLCGDARL